MLVHILVASALLFAACAAEPKGWRGRVVAVADGDTLTIEDGARLRHKIRLSDIDAPEKQQPFGQRSRQSLADMCVGKEAVVAARGQDRYGRTLARAYCGNVDASAEQVRRGMAWVFDKYVTDRSLYFIQDEAKAARRGMWLDSSPMPPWEFRAEERIARGGN